MNGRHCCDRRSGCSDVFLCVLCVLNVVHGVESELPVTRPLVIKFGGELIEDRAHLATVVAALTRLAGAGAPLSRPLVVVHGGGKEIDAALKSAGIEKRQVEGLRITDEETLDLVVSVLAGAVNTRLVAALNTAGVRAVGLTGADGSCGLSAAAPPHRTV